MQTFEVSVELENGHYINLLVAAPTAEIAADAAHSMLQNVSEPKAERDVIRFCWKRADMTVKPVEIIDTPSDFWTPDLTRPAATA